jgi:hypothetical protein
VLVGNGVGSGVLVGSKVDVGIGDAVGGGVSSTNFFFQDYFHHPDFLLTVGVA